MASNDVTFIHIDTQDQMCKGGTYIHTHTQVHKQPVLLRSQICEKLRHDYLSVHSYGTTRFQLNRYSWNLIFEHFFENLSRNFKFHYNLTRIPGTLHEDLRTFMIVPRSILLRMRNFSYKSCKENQNAQFMLSNLFSRISCRLWEKV